MVLIVEDEGVSRKALAALLLANGYPAEAVRTAEEALQVVDRGPVPDVALVDLDLPGIDGEELIRRLKRDSPSIQTILISAADEDRIAQVAQHRQVLHIQKPIDFKRLLRILDGTSAGGWHCAGRAGHSDHQWPS